jgi:hypothetical protein
MGSSHSTANITVVEPSTAPVIMIAPGIEDSPAFSSKTSDVIGPVTRWYEQWRYIICLCWSNRFNYPRYTHCCGFCGFCSLCAEACQINNGVCRFLQEYSNKNSSLKNLDLLYWGLNTSEGTLFCCPSTLCNYAVAVCECSLVKDDWCCFSLFACLIFGTVSTPFCLPCVLGNTCMNTLLYCVTCDSRNFDLSWFC